MAMAPITAGAIIIFTGATGYAGARDGLKAPAMQHNDATVSQRRTQLLAFTPHSSGSLIGFADFELPSGLRMLGCTVHVQGPRCWIKPPGKPKIDKDGRAAREMDAKRIAYTACIGFRDAIRRRWSDAILACLAEAGIDIPTQESVP
jgi:hypothetical protein